MDVTDGTERYTIHDERGKGGKGGRAQGKAREGRRGGEGQARMNLKVVGWVEDSHRNTSGGESANDGSGNEKRDANAGAAAAARGDRHIGLSFPCSLAHGALSSTPRSPRRLLVRLM